MRPDRSLCWLICLLWASYLVGQPVPVSVMGVQVVAPSVDTVSVTEYMVTLATVPEGCDFSGGGPLPVTAPELAARRVDPKTVLLRWNRRLEEENSWWLERRLTDESEFTDLRQLTVTDLVNREWTDANDHGGVSYYRLRGEDPVGEIGYSRIRQVGNDADANLWLAPNPTAGRVQVRFPKQEIFQFTIIDGRGRRVRSGRVRSSDWVELTGLPAGVYLLQLRAPGAGEAVVRRVILR